MVGENRRELRLGEFNISLLFQYSFALLFVICNLSSTARDTLHW